MAIQIEATFDKPTSTLTYLVYDPETKDALVVDPLLDFEPQGAKLSKESFEKLQSRIDELKLNLHYILETHVHADHITSAQWIRRANSNAKTVIHKNITEVQQTFSALFNSPDWFNTDGSAFDILIDDEGSLTAGSISIKAIHTPGHTPACVCYLVNDTHLFAGDSIFMPDFGTGRCDFPGGSAETLYHSLHDKLYKLPDDTQIYVGHDYQPGGRDLEYQTTIGHQKTSNIHLKEQTTKDEFVEFRTSRDSTLKAPKLLLQSLQINCNNGVLPPAEPNGTSYLKIPLEQSSL